MERLSINCGRIFKNKIKNEIEKLKSGKASGGDDTPPEILKVYLNTTGDSLYNLLKKWFGRRKL